MDNGMPDKFQTKSSMDQPHKPFLECWEEHNGIAIRSNGTGIYTIAEVNDFVRDLVSIGRNVAKRRPQN